MRPRWLSLAHPSGIARWEGPAALLLLLVVMFAVAALSLSADRLKWKLDWVQAAQTDNSTWLVSQLEVDVLKLLQATQPPLGDNHLAADLAQVRSRYDVLFSRTEVVGVSLGREGWYGADWLRRDWRQLATRVGRLAAIVDAADPQLESALPAMRAEVADLAQAIRRFSVNGLMVLIEDSTSRREALETLLHKFLQLGACLILLLMTVAGGTIVLLRRLQTRAAQTERIKGNIEKAIEASLDAVLVADASGRIVSYNLAAQLIFGFCRHEAIGADLASLVIPERLRAASEGVPPGFSMDPDGQVVNRGRRVLVAQRKDGTEFPIEATIVSDLDARGQTTYFGFFRDISDRIRVEGRLKRARDIAMRSEEVKSRFLAVMSHEMRTPLNGLIAALDIVTETTELSARQAHFLRIARSCSLSALEQVNDVLELTLLDEGQLQEEPSAFDVIGLILEISEQFRPMAEQRNSLLELALPTREVPHFWGYRRLFAQVLSNLLGNAIKFTDSGKVLISTQFVTPPDGAPIVRVEVSDTGIGIAREKLARIFDDFETLDGSYSRSRQGTGLGLGIARRAVKYMKGEIGVESRIGRGSTFWFTVPLTLPDTVVPTEAAPAHGGEEAAIIAPRGCSVLVAEDNAINREVLHEMLVYCGHSVTEATNGEEAVVLATNTMFDVVLMDISMPVMDGIEASVRIREGGASAAALIVGLTAHAFPDEIERFRANGMDEVIVKPITIAKLQAFLSSRASETASPCMALGEFRPPVASPPAPLIDDEVFGELCELLNPAVHDNALEEFDREICDLLVDLRSDSSLEAELARAVHRVGGSAAVLGALRLRILLNQLEAGSAGDLAALVRAISECHEATLRAMRSRLSAIAT